MIVIVLIFFGISGLVYGYGYVFVVENGVVEGCVILCKFVVNGIGEKNIYCGVI